MRIMIRSTTFHDHVASPSWISNAGYKEDSDSASGQSRIVSAISNCLARFRADKCTAMAAGLEETDGCQTLLEEAISPISGLIALQFDGFGTSCSTPVPVLPSAQKASDVEGATTLCTPDIIDRYATA